MLLRPKSPLNQRFTESPLISPHGRKIGPKRNLKKKGCLASQRNSLEKHNNNKLKNLTTNNQQNLLLFILHKPVSLIQAIVQPITTVHVNLGVDRLIEALNERIHSLQERRIACSISCYQVACR